LPAINFGEASRMSKSIHPHRRALLAAGPAVLAASPAASAAPAAAPAYAPPMAGSVPVVLPRTELVWEALVELSPTVDLGDSPLGRRRIVPITGGTFAGPRLRGVVLAGGADRQLVRKDGVTRLEALYEMRTDDGAVITVLNRVTIDRPEGRAPYTFSTLEVTAPEGPHAWLNRLAFVGTLHPLPPERRAVLIRVYNLA
jgi:hypothetical protein